jgi:FMN phosphatase YigB (HAD superfamily)
VIKAVIFDFFGVIEQAGESSPLLIGYIKNELKPKYKIGIISNAAGDWVSKLLTDEEAAIFDDVTISYKAGAAKPNPAIYHASLKKLGVEPSEAVFIDDIEDYCLAARKLGMHAIHYQSFAQLERELKSLLTVSDN